MPHWGARPTWLISGAVEGERGRDGGGWPWASGGILGEVRGTQLSRTGMMLMVLKPWVQDPGSSWGRDPRVLSSGWGRAPGCPWGRDRAPCVSLGEGQGPLCGPGGGTGPPVWPWGRGAGSPGCPWGKGQGPLGGPGRGGQGPLGGPGGASGVQAALPVSWLPEQRWTSGHLGAVCPPFPQRPPLPCRGSSPAAGCLSGRPSVWRAVCLAGLWEREAAVCFLNQRWGTQPAAWASPGGTGLRTLPTRASITGCPLQEATLDPGLGVGPWGASVPGATSSHLFGLSPWEDKAGRSGEPGWAQRLLLGPRPAEGRPWWACGASRALAGCPAGSSWPWVDQGGPGGVAQPEAHMKPRTRAEDGRPGPVPLQAAVPSPGQWGTLGTLSPVPLGAELPCSGI